jgi:hypothetical protein
MSARSIGNDTTARITIAGRLVAAGQRRDRARFRRK